MLLLALLPVPSFAQRSDVDSLWMPFRFFLGSWKGTGSGEPGNGTYERTYSFALGKRFIEVKNKSHYPSTGQTHEDVGYISYDKGRKKFNLRQFHTEGFINHYVLDSTATDGKTIVFITEAIENLPRGWRAKETYQLVSDKEFHESFEISEPGKPFQFYSETILKRQD